MTSPVWLIFFVTINISRITNFILAPIRVCSTSSSISKFSSSLRPSLSKMSRCYHHKRRLPPKRHCSSHRSRTGCRFQRPPHISTRGGGCGRRKKKLKWKSSGSTARKSGRFYRHDKPSTVFGTYQYSRPEPNCSSHFQEACSRPTSCQYFFDALDNIDDIMFTDSFTTLS